MPCVVAWPSNPPHHTSVLLRDSAFALSPMFQAAVSIIFLRPYLAKKQILAILHLISQFWGQHCFSIWSTATLQHPPRPGHHVVMQHYTHKWVVAQGVPRGVCAFTRKREKRATAINMSSYNIYMFEFHGKVTVRWFCSSCLPLPPASGWIYCRCSGNVP